MNAKKLSAVLTAALLAGVCFCGNILPLSENYVNRYFDYRAVWQETDAVLDRIPDDASVTATTFLVVPLSRRAVLYDLRYCSQEHLLSTDYVVVETTDSGSIVQTLQAKASCSRRSVRRWSRGSSSMPPPAPNKPFTAPAAAPVSPARSHVPRFCIRDPSG